eukprot:TRINITY_DN16904_c0_g1_i2.p2 TRINITY_DN16904_c0_g1~~TRINITY_DN16904_c0_g1_i2.p2  ORF type:complete len:130 (-),score=6.03 TRINITY_DN16904_c0_g1_i2:781-1170(-)
MINSQAPSQLSTLATARSSHTRTVKTAFVFNKQRGTRETEDEEQKQELARTVTAKQAVAQTRRNQNKKHHTCEYVNAILSPSRFHSPALELRPGTRRSRNVDICSLTGSSPASLMASTEFAGYNHHRLA